MVPVSLGVASARQHGIVPFPDRLANIRRDIADDQSDPPVIGRIRSGCVKHPPGVQDDIGRFVAPDFQREFEWKPRDISDLMRSIFLDYYIGSLLLWKGKEDNFATLACEPIYVNPGEGVRRSILCWTDSS